jgi:hypothetical protein
LFARLLTNGNAQTAKRVANVGKQRITKCFTVFNVTEAFIYIAWACETYPKVRMRIEMKVLMIFTAKNSLGQYHCDNCNVCSDCGAKSPEGHFNGSLTQQQRQDLAMIAQWNHEFTINSLTKIREHTASFCLPCFRKAKKTKVDE